MLPAGPFHLGADNLGFVRKAKEILRNPQRRPRRPWSLQANGDLWELFARAAHQRGPHSVAISWVKGHVTDAQVRAGTHTLADKLGNDEADELADRGVQGHGTAACRLSRHWALRHTPICWLAYMRSLRA